jgi:hypothetical protein
MRASNPWLLLVLCAACGGQAALTPDDIGRRAFAFLKADDFTSYFTQIVVTPAIARQTCPGIIGADRFFESGEGSERQQSERFVQCRANVDFARAVLSRVRVQRKSPELVPPQCPLPLERVDVIVDLTVDGDLHYFVVSDVTQFGGGWRAYRRLRDCGTVDPA